ncbi:hypothetical protein TVAG_066480 [Trichomonas vaginalis G3]|uniref:Uncharacterized protein n=1 Tax=Trichomonas vaginalis (strain ATCC PRA-98 / G3) TaxID=412133 RepID=A2FFI1_TRIV3|nr:hypothetical protein TVAG_066480 [Trichomonas vaginalis G3]|eukprot:XP_001309281.1 hypothetical protein [Trichomonas vaginalis G3]
MFLIDIGNSITKVGKFENGKVSFDIPSMTDNKFPTLFSIVNNKILNSTLGVSHLCIHEEDMHRNFFERIEDKSDTLEPEINFAIFLKSLLQLLDPEGKYEYIIVYQEWWDKDKSIFEIIRDSLQIANLDKKTHFIKSSDMISAYIQEYIPLVQNSTVIVYDSGDFITQAYKFEYKDNNLSLMKFDYDFLGGINLTLYVYNYVIDHINIKENEEIKKIYTLMKNQKPNDKEKEERKRYYQCLINTSQKFKENSMSGITSLFNCEQITTCDFCMKIKNDPEIYDGCKNVFDNFVKKFNGINTVQCQEDNYTNNDELKKIINSKNQPPTKLLQTPKTFPNLPPIKSVQVQTQKATSKRNSDQSEGSGIKNTSSTTSPEEDLKCLLNQLKQNHPHIDSPPAIDNSPQNQGKQDPSVQKEQSKNESSPKVDSPLAIDNSPQNQGKQDPSVQKEQSKNESSPKVDSPLAIDNSPQNQGKQDPSVQKEQSKNESSPKVDSPLAIDNSPQNQGKQDPSVQKEQSKNESSPKVDSPLAIDNSPQNQGKQDPSVQKEQSKNESSPKVDSPPAIDNSPQNQGKQDPSVQKEQSKNESSPKVDSPPAIDNSPQNQGKQDPSVQKEQSKNESSPKVDSPLAIDNSPQNQGKQDPSVQKEQSKNESSPKVDSPPAIDNSPQNQGKQDPSVQKEQSKNESSPKVDSPPAIDNSPQNQGKQDPSVQKEQSKNESSPKDIIICVGGNSLSFVFKDVFRQNNFQLNVFNQYISCFPGKDKYLKITENQKDLVNLQNKFDDLWKKDEEMKEIDMKMDQIEKNAKAIKEELKIDNLDDLIDDENVVEIENIIKKKCNNDNSIIRIYLPYWKY